VKNGVMFGRVVKNGRKSVGFYGATKDVIIGFGAATGENDVARGGANQVCNRLTSLFNSRA